MSPLFRFPGAAPRSPAVETWLHLQGGEIGAIARQWYEVMRASGPDCREILHDGHPTACVTDAAFAYVDTFPSHVNIGFFRGASLPDPDQLLEGTGRRMRHVKVRPGQPPPSAALANLIRAAYADMPQQLRAEHA